MKIWIACASALVLLAACGSSKEATAALTAMNITDGKTGVVQFAKKSGMGDKVTLTDVTIGPEGDADRFKAKTMTLAGLKVTKEGKPLFSEMTLKDISPAKDVPGLTFNLASATIKNPNEVTGVYLASAFTKEGPAATAPAFADWELGKVSFNGLKVNMDLKKMGQGEGSINISMDEASVGDLKKTVFGAARLAGLKGDFNIPESAGLGMPIVGKFDFGTGDVKGIQGGLFADAATAGAKAGAGGDAASASQVQTNMFAKMTSPIDPGYDSIAWTPISIEASGAKLFTTKVDQKATRNAQGIVTSVSAPQTKLTFTANAADGQLGAMISTGLGAIGYDTIELYGQGDATFDPATDTTRYGKYNFGMTNGFDIQMTGGFQGLLKAVTSLMGSLASMETGALTPVEPDKPAASGPDMSGVEQLKVVDLDLTITDKSLVNHLLMLSSMAGSSDPEAFRKDLVTQIEAFAGDLSKAESNVDPAVTKELADAVASFVKQPGTLAIKLKPTAPTTLFAPNQKLTKAQLGFSATSTPGPVTPVPAPPPAKK